MFLFGFLITAFACHQDTTTSTYSQKDTPALNQNIELVFPSDNQAPVKHAVIWLHGLGATSNDFPPIVPHLGLNPQRPIRFVFPQAPDRPITVNGGMVMPGWYDIKGIDIASKEDREGMEESRATVESLIDQQIKLGVPAKNIILAGFSQGGAVTYYAGTRSDHKLAGMLAMSTYLVFKDQTADEQSNKNVDTPIFASHGTQDAVVPVALGQQSAEHLQSLGYSVDWETYAMEHQVVIPQIKAIGEWINKTFGD